MVLGKTVGVVKRNTGGSELWEIETVGTSDRACSADDGEGVGITSWMANLIDNIKEMRRS